MKLLPDWYAALESRVQKRISLVAFIGIMGLLYLLLWQPLMAAKTLEMQRVSGAEEDLRWLLHKSAEVHALGGGKSATLSGVLDSSLKQYRLQPSKKVLNQRTGEWQLHFTAVDFRELLLWLNRLRRDSLATIVSADINRLSAGRIQVRLTLTEG